MNVLSPSNALYLGGGVEQAPVETSTAAGSSRVDVRAIWTALRRNLPLIIGAVAAALIAALIVTLLTTPRYIAQASVQIDQESDRVLSTQDVQPTSAYQDADRFLQTEVDVLQSRAMAIRVAQALKLFGNADFYRAMGAKPSLATGRPDPVGEQEKTLGLLGTNLRVNLPRNSRVVVISFESPDAALAARVANTYAKAFITGNLQRKYESSAYARDFLGNQLVEAKARLENTERQLNAYARSAGLMRRLGTDRVDVIALHDATPKEAAGSALRDVLASAVAKGHARATSIASSSDAIAAGLAVDTRIAFAQFPDTPFTRSLDRVRLGLGERSAPTFLTHGVFGGGTLERFVALAQAARGTIDALATERAYDGDSPENALLMDYALSANAQGIVLASMFSPGHIVANCRIAALSPEPRVVGIVRRVIDERG